MYIYMSIYMSMYTYVYKYTYICTSSAPRRQPYTTRAGDVLRRQRRLPLLPGSLRVAEGNYDDRGLQVPGDSTSPCSPTRPYVREHYLHPA